MSGWSASTATTRCLVPVFDGALFSQTWKDALSARFSTGAPQRQRRSVEQAAFDRIARAICDAVAARCEALFLDLHGAMVTEDSDDGEGKLLERIRTIAPRLPIAVALDFHANVSARMVANATIITGYRTYPHTDVVETGYRAGRLLLATIAERIVPTMEREICSVLPNILCQTTDSPPMSELMAAAREAEAGEALAVSVFAGFLLADAADTDFSAVVVIDNDRSKARRIGCRVSDGTT